MTTESKGENFYEQPFSDTYNFDLAGTVFTTPLYRANVAFNYDFGNVQTNSVVHVATQYNVSEVRLHYDSYGERRWYGESFQQTVVKVNGTDAWRQGGTTGLFNNFDYEQTHHIRYAENITAYVPMSDAGTPVWDWTQAPSINNAGVQGNRLAVRVDDLTGIFYVSADLSSAAFRADNDTKAGGSKTSGFDGYFWLANVTHPTLWSANTTYQDRIPETLSIAYQFQTQPTFLAAADAQDDSCGGIARFFETLVGICPSIAGIARWTTTLIPNVLGFFLDFINPNAGDAVRYLGDTAAEFVASYIFLLTIIASSPGNLFIVLSTTLSGAAFIGGGLRGDFQSILEMHRTLFKGLFIAAFWYFYVYWLLIRWIVDRIIQMLSAIGQYIPFT